MSVIEVRRCLLCGEAFAISPRQMNKIYCCDCKKAVAYVRVKEYQQKHRREINKRRAENYIPHFHTFTCQMCGKQGIAKHGATKYCLECLKNSKDWKLRNYYSKRKPEIEKY